MNDRQRAWDVIPPTAKIVALLLTIGFGFLVRFALLPEDPQMARWQEWQKDLFSFCIPLVVFIYVLLIGYVHGDAKRRGMRYVMWTLLAIFIPNAIGIILYFILRDPLPSPCRNCQEQVRAAFAYCPKCGSLMKRVCDGCGRAVESDWMNCAYCGKKLMPATAIPETAGGGSPGAAP
jgi:hypothetical protein